MPDYKGLITDIYAKKGLDASKINDETINTISERYKDDVGGFLNDLYDKKQFDKSKLTDETIGTIKQRYGFTQEAQAKKPKESKPKGVDGAIQVAREETGQRLNDRQAYEYFDEKSKGISPQQLSVSQKRPWLNEDATKQTLSNREKRKEKNQALTYKGELENFFRERDGFATPEEGYAQHMKEESIKKIDETIQALDDIVKKGGKTVHNYGGNVVISTSKEYDEAKHKLSDLRDLRDLYKKGLKIAQSPEGRDFEAQMKGFAEGIFKSPLAADYFTFGVNEIARNNNIVAAFEKPEEERTPEERALLQAYYDLQEFASGRMPNRGGRIGEGVAEMLPYIVQFAATNGIGTAARESVEAGFANMAKRYLTNAAKKGLTSEAKQQAVSKAITGTGKAIGYATGAGAQTLANPQMISREATTRMLPQLEYDEAGQPHIVAGEKPGEAIAKAFGITYAEFFGENFGGVFGSMDNALKKNPKGIMRAVAGVSDGWNKLLGDKLEKVGWHGLFEEYLEEQVTGLIQSPINQDWSFFTDLNNQLDLLGTLAVTQGAFGMNNNVSRMRIKRGWKEAQEITQNVDDPEYMAMIQEVEELYANDAKGRDERFQTVNQAYQPSEKDVKIAKNYIIRKAAYDALETVKQDQYKDAVTEMSHEDGNAYFITLDNGSQVYLKSGNPEADGEMLVGMDGEGKSHSFSKKNISKIRPATPEEMTQKLQSQDNMEEEVAAKEERNIAEGYQVGNLVYQPDPAGGKTVGEIVDFENSDVAHVLFKGEEVPRPIPISQLVTQKQVDAEEAAAQQAEEEQAALEAQEKQNETKSQGNGSDERQNDTTAPDGDSNVSQESAETAIEYPTKKDGSIDYDSVEPNQLQGALQQDGFSEEEIGELIQEERNNVAEELDKAEKKLISAKKLADKVQLKKNIKALQGKLAQFDGMMANNNQKNSQKDAVLRDDVGQKTSAQSENEEVINNQKGGQNISETEQSEPEKVNPQVEFKLTNNPNIKYAKNEDGTLKTKSEYTSDEWRDYTESVIAEKTKELAKAESEAATSKGKKQPQKKGIMQTASELEVFDVPSIIMQHFISGGKINTNAIQEIFGGGTNEKEAVKAERNKRISYIKKDAPTIDGLAHDLWQQNEAVTPNATDVDYRDEIINIISSYNHPASMAKDLISLQSQGQNQEISPEEQAYNAEILEQQLIEEVILSEYTALEADGLLPTADFYVNLQLESQENEQQNDPRAIQGDNQTESPGVSEEGGNKPAGSNDKGNIQSEGSNGSQSESEELKKLRSELKRKQSERKKHDKEFNDRNGLFGDQKAETEQDKATAAGEQALFDVPTDISQDNYNRVVGTLDKEIADLKTAIAKLEASEQTGAKENSGQKKLNGESNGQGEQAELKEESNTHQITEPAPQAESKEVAPEKQGGESKESQEKKIEDFGEQIKGAKKDIYKRLEKVTDNDIASQPLSKSFPRPDFAKLVEDGLLTEQGAVLVKFLYDNIPTKPRKTYKVASWAKTVRQAIDTFNDVLQTEGNDAKLTEAILNSESYGLADRFSIFQALQKEFGFPKNDVLLGSYEVKRFISSDQEAKEYAIVKGRSITGRFKTPEEAARALKKILDTNKGKAKEVALSVYQDRTTKKYFIGKKAATGVVRVMDNIETGEEAFKILKNQNAQLQELWNAKKLKPEERRKKNRDRVGTDYRNGKDVTPEQFTETFGFRGTQFGNWVKNDERQESLNDAYDAFMDLANALNISPRALSLGGELGMAFGARGGGKYSAHYEPGQIVINLTKTKGAGTLAHEWWHAIDNYFSRMRGSKDLYVTSNPKKRTRYDRQKGWVEDNLIRSEMLDAFKAVTDAIHKSKIPKRSAALDGTRTKRYWSDIIEMSARSFENFIITKLGETNEQNDYLANYKETGEWIQASGLSMDNYPYPLEDESASINEAFSQFFNTIQEKEENGNTVLFRKKKGENTTLSTEKEIALPEYWQGKTFGYTHNPNPSVYLGERFGQNVEPAGKYINLDYAFVAEGNIEGQVSFQNPLVIDTTNKPYPQWKTELSEKYGETGKELSDKLREEGYDAIITVEEYKGKYYPSETVILNPEIDSKQGLRFRKTSPLGFYSTVENALESIKQEKGTPEQFKAMLLKNGAKQAEMDWMDFDSQFSGQKSITKAEIQDWIDANKIDVQEVEKKNAATPSQIARYRELEDNYDNLTEEEKKEFENLSDLVDSNFDGKTGTKYSQYQLPGGENYKELLLTLPEKSDLWEAYKDSQTGKMFQSGHFPESNILAHIRFNERFDKDGNRVLFIEEIQSDWAQSIRKKGVATKWKPEQLRILSTEEAKAVSIGENLWGVEATNEEGEQEQVFMIQKSKAPTEKDVIDYIVNNKTRTRGEADMPFKQTDQWVNLAMRRMMRYAAENGFDRIAWTTGEQQAGRYDLSKDVDNVITRQNSDGSYELDITYKKGNDIFENRRNTYNVYEDELPDYVGKELAERIVNDTKEGFKRGINKQEYSGLDLVVGGEGMKGFYDKIVPSLASKLGKKFGAKVAPIEFGSFEEWYKENRSENDPAWGELQKLPEAEQKTYEDAYREEMKSDGQIGTQLSLPITPKMKQSVLEGIPLFRQSKTPEQIFAENPDMAFLKNAYDKNEEIRTELDRLSEKYGVPVEYVVSYEQLPNYIADELKRQAGDVITGVFDKKTGKVYAIIPAISDVQDAQKLFLHEVVGHYGIDKILGREDVFLDTMYKIYDGMNLEQVQYYENLYGTKDPVIIASEYLAEVAEDNPTLTWVGKAISAIRKAIRAIFPDMKMNKIEVVGLIAKSRSNLKKEAKNTAQQRVSAIARDIDNYVSNPDKWDKEFFERRKISNLVQYETESVQNTANESYDPQGRFADDLFSRHNYDSGKQLTAKELRQEVDSQLQTWIDNHGLKVYDKDVVDYWFNKLPGITGQVNKEGYQGNDVFSLSHEIYKHLPENSKPPKKSWVDLSSPDLQYRKKLSNPAPTEAEATEKLNDKLYRRFVDRMQPYINFQSKGVGMGAKLDKTSNFELAENRQSSIAKAKFDKYHDGERQELIDAAMPLYQKKGYDALSEYMMAKHAGERNLELLTREAEQKGYDKEKVDEYIKTLDNDNRSGYTTEEADKIIKAFEKDFDKKSLDKFWTAVKKNSDYVLDRYHEAGFIDKKTKEHYQSMYENYVPLRGWDESEAENTEYFRDTFTGKVNMNKKAEGRSSIAADPLATMVNMAYSAIASGEKNLAKQKAFYFVLGNQEVLKPMAELKEYWQVPVGKDVYEYYTQEEFMQLDESRREGAKKVNAKEKQAKMSKAQAAEKEVHVWVNGRMYTMVFDDLKVAHALNKESSPMVTQLGEFLQNSVGRVTRRLSGLLTSDNPAFIIPNLIKDTLFAVEGTFIEDGGKAAAKLTKNIFKVQRALVKFQQGKEDNTKLGGMMKDFVELGGQTGYSHLESVDQIKKTLAKELRNASIMSESKLAKYAVEGIKKPFELIEHLASWSENVSRFATYVTAIEMGKSKEEAIAASKNVTVNFNRKGELSGILGSLYMFFNARMQGIARVFKLAKTNPGRFAAVAAGHMAIGYASMLLFDMLTGGDDDKDQNISDYMKFKYLVIPGGENGYVSIPLPHGTGFFHGLGVLTYEMLSGKKEPMEATGIAVSNALSEFAPMDIASISADNDLAENASVFVPSALKPIYDVAVTNKDYLGRDIARTPFTKGDEEVKAESQMYYKNVNPVAKYMTDLLYEIGGGDPNSSLRFKKGTTEPVNKLLDQSPEHLEYLVESYTGGAGKFFNDIYKSIIAPTVNAASEEGSFKDNYVNYVTENVSKKDIPVFNRFIRSYYGDPIISNYYDQKHKLEVLGKWEAEFKKAKDRESRIELRSQPEYKQYRKMKIYDRRIKSYNDRIRNHPESPEVDNWKAKRKDLMEEFLKYIEEDGNSN